MLRENLALLLALAALWASEGCVPPDGAPREVVFDPCGAVVVPDGEVTSEEVGAIDAALSMWNQAGELGMVRSSEDPPSAIRVRFAAAAPPFRGLYDPARGVVWINDGIVDSEERALTIAHELGHAFDLSHVALSERASLMNPGRSTVTPTAADVALLRALWGDCREANPPMGIAGDP